MTQQQSAMFYRFISSNTMETIISNGGNRVCVSQGVMANSFLPLKRRAITFILSKGNNSFFRLTLTLLKTKRDHYKQSFLELPLCEA